MQFLQGMYEAHGSTASIEGDWVVVEEGRLHTRAAHVTTRQHSESFIL